MDGDLLLFIQEYIRNDFLDPIMIFITHTGDYGILCIAVAFILILIPKTRILGHLTGFSIGIEFIINNVLIKNLVARIRPYEVIEDLILMIEPQPDYSFPSGHTGVTFAFAGVMLYALIYGIDGGLSKTKGYRLATLGTLLYAVLLAFSRLYVGVHYPTDVLGGLFIGLISGCAGYHIEKAVRKKWEQRKHKAA